MQGTNVAPCGMINIDLTKYKNFRSVIFQKWKVEASTLGRLF